MVRLSYFIALIIATLFSTSVFAQSKKEKEEIKKITEKALRSAEHAFKDAKSNYVVHSFFEERSSSLSLSKSFSGESKTSSTTFTVEKEARKIKLSLNGRCSYGEIILEIMLPNGTLLKKVTINDTADVSWTQTILLKSKDKSTKDMNKYIGEWKLKISTNKAKGNYHLGLSTY
ncbi:hypothetical protein EMN47_01120 [Prolixibacteraceae bacterium JC049]|jgi:hypothetical protein|nr:hypothetical protein [Prolixibacteraceae bacterium JC049]